MKNERRSGGEKVCKCCNLKYLFHFNLVISSSITFQGIFLKLLYRTRIGLDKNEISSSIFVSFCFQDNVECPCLSSKSYRVMATMYPRASGPLFVLSTLVFFDFDLNPDNDDDSLPMQPKKTRKERKTSSCLFCIKYHILFRFCVSIFRIWKKGIE